MPGVIWLNKLIKKYRATRAILCYGKNQTNKSYCKLITYTIGLRNGKVYPESVTFTFFSKAILNCYLSSKWGKEAKTCFWESS